MAISAVRNLLTDPPWRAEDLGHPLPDSPFAVSVALPLWEHVLGYEEGDPDVLDRMRAGYPRFFIPRAVRKLQESVLGEHGRAGEQCAIYACEAAAERCRSYVVDRADGWDVRLADISGGAATAVLFPEQISAIAGSYWRYCGEGVSGRLAAAISAGERIDPGEGEDDRNALRAQIAAHTGQDTEDVFLLPTGMAAVSAVHRVLGCRSPGWRSVQFDFPYVDALRVQRELGSGVAFFPSGDAAALAQLVELFDTGEGIAGLYCELPSNPLLRSVDLRALAALTEPRAVPLIVDDTVATNRNVDVFPYADLVTTSLTKYYSGVGDAMGGAIVVRSDGPLAGELRDELHRQCDVPICGADATVLAGNARGYEERVDQINEGALQLVNWLSEHPRVERVWYPTTETPENYEAVRRSGGGWGGLFSILLKDAPRTAPSFYDALRLCKGPSLGTEFSLACPYTLLAHYEELDWCEALGVSRWLIRFSCGLEPVEDLIGRFEDAFEASS